MGLLCPYLFESQTTPNYCTLSFRKQIGLHQVLKKGDIFEAQVVDLTSSGQGVVKHSSGISCFSSGVWLEEVGRFQVIEVKKRFAHVELVELIQASSERRDAPCKYSGSTPSSCGGCPWMFVNYDAQLQAKQKRVKTAISRINPHWVNRIEQIIGSPQELKYRNRIQLKSDAATLGFLAEKSHRLIDIDQCEVVVEPIQNKITSLRKTLPNKDWLPAKKHKWVTIDIDDNIDIESIQLNKRLAFKQANDAQNTLMREWLSSTIDTILAKHIQANKSKKISVVELFCGAGNFTSVLASKNVNVLAAECNEESVHAIHQQGWDSVTAKVIDLFKPDAFKRFIASCKGMDILILDPPRDGMKIKDGLFNKKVAPQYVLYISCDLATFTRDLSEFSENGYKLQSLTPIDLFPQTPHVELMAYLRKKA